MENDQVLVIPVNFDVIVGAHFLQIIQIFLDSEGILVVGDFEQGHVLVGVRAPAPEVSTQQVLAHLDAALKDFLVRRHLSFKADAQRETFDSNEIFGSRIRLEAFVPGEVLLLAQKLPELESQFCFDIKHANECQILVGSKN